MVNMIRQLASFFRVPERVTLLFTDRGDDTAAPVSPSNPLPVTIQGGPAPGGGSSGGESEVVTVVYPPLTLTAGFRQGLLPPGGATRARVWRMGGTASLGLGTAQESPALTWGQPLDLRDEMLQSARINVFDGGTDAYGNPDLGAVRVEYWRVGPPRPEDAPPAVEMNGTLTLACATANTQAACQLPSLPGTEYLVRVTPLAGGPFVAWIIANGEPSGMFDLSSGTEFSMSATSPADEYLLRVAPDPRLNGTAQPGTVRVETLPAATSGQL